LSGIVGKMTNPSFLRQAANVETARELLLIEQMLQNHGIVRAQQEEVVANHIARTECRDGPEMRDNSACIVMERHMQFLQQSKVERSRLLDRLRSAQDQLQKLGISVCAQTRKASAILHSKNVLHAMECSEGATWFQFTDGNEIIVHQSALSKCSACEFELVVFPKFPPSARYGRFCGQGWSHPQEQPMDDIDACCQIHDTCADGGGIECHAEFAKCIARSTGQSNSAAGLITHNQQFASETRASILQTWFAAVQHLRPSASWSRQALQDKNNVPKILQEVITSANALKTSRDFAVIGTIAAVFAAPMTGGASVLAAVGGGGLAAAKATDVQQELAQSF
jgi:hypothetical protein